MATVATANADVAELLHAARVKNERRVFFFFCGRLCLWVFVTLQGTYFEKKKIKKFFFLS